MTFAPAGHPSVARWMRIGAGAVAGHAAGAVVGVVLIAGPALRWSTATALFMVQLVADLATALGAIRLGQLRRRHALRVLLAVVGTGAVASWASLWPLGAWLGWLVVRAVVVVAVAVVTAGHNAIVRP